MKIPYYKRFYLSERKWTTDVLEWGRAMQTMDRRVAHTYTTWNIFRVSTVFLGLDHSFNPNVHKPILFETMVFCRFCRRGEECDMDRYSTKKEALAGHEQMVYKWNKPHHLLKHFIERHIWKKR